MLTASGFGWSILTQIPSPKMNPKLITTLVFIVLYLVIALLPLCCKMREEEVELPLHEQMKDGDMLNRQTELSSDDSGSSSLFKTPPGILRSQF